MKGKVIMNFKNLTTNRVEYLFNLRRSYLGNEILLDWDDLFIDQLVRHGIIDIYDNINLFGEFDIMIFGITNKNYYKAILLGIDFSSVSFEPYDPLLF